MHYDCLLGFRFVRVVKQNTMQEPTFRQHKKLEELKNGFSMRKGDEQDMEIIWELVRMGMVKNFALLSGKYDWSFEVTEDGENYLSAMANEA